MTKEETFAYVLANISKLSHENQHLSREGKNKSQRLCITLRAHSIDIPDLETHEEIRKFFTGEKNNCEICGNLTKLNSNNIKNGFKQFCSRNCQLTWRSKIQSENNTSKRIRDKKAWKEKLSRKLKNSILDGKFTPNVTNSWCHSRRKVILKDREVNVRSSWEEKFLLMNPTFCYEITRIPYVDSFGKRRIYIVDFTDSDGNLYEIKPSSKIGESSEKILAARAFCEKNNLKFHLITEKYFGL